MIKTLDQSAATASPRISTAATRVGDVRSPKFMPILVAVSVVVALILLYVTSYMNFFWDEWDFISYARPWNVNVLLLPHNEHWSTIPILLWKVLFATVGIRSHVPYEALNLVAHLAAVLLLFAQVRRRSGDLPGFAAALIFLVLGTGGTDIVWAFQIGWTGAVAFGLLAMLLYDEVRPQAVRVIAATAALLCSLMCAGIGLAFLAAIAVELAVDRRRRRLLISLVLPVAAYGEWFLAYGAGLPGSPGEPCISCIPTGLGSDFNHVQFGTGYLIGLASFIAWGAASSAAGIVGFPGLAGIVLPLMAALIALHWYRQGGVHVWQVGMTAGLFAQFVITGLVRAQQGPSAAGHPRYVYVGVAFLLPIVADAARELPWRSLWRPALIAAFAVCVLGNLSQLRDRALFETVPGIHPYGSQIELMRIENAELQTVEVFRGAPDMNLNRGLDDATMPQLNAGPYLAAVTELGSPIAPTFLDRLDQMPHRAVDTVMLNLFGHAVAVTADNNKSTAGLPCQSVDASSGAAIDSRVAAGERIMLRSSNGGLAYIFLGFLDAPTSKPLQRLPLSPDTAEWIYLPNTGKQTTWRLRIEISPMGMIQFCGSAAAQVTHPAGLYRAKAANGQLGPGWSSVPDPAASDGIAAKVTSGTSTTYRSDLFGDGFSPFGGTYDVWFRVRVRVGFGAAPEMILGLWDDQTRGWVASTTYASDQVSTRYQWLKVATGISLNSQHTYHFLAAATLRVGTDWYVDEALMVPSGSGTPTL